jgi:hypothetical protein
VDPAALALGIIAVVCVVTGAASELGAYHTAVNTRSLVVPADLTVLQTLTADYPSKTVVMTNGNNDAGMWITGLTDLTPMVPNGFEEGSLSLGLDVALANACTDPGDAVAAIERESALTNASIVFIGAHTIASPMFAWKVSCIAKLPDLRLITSAPWQGSTAAAFAVVK